MDLIGVVWKDHPLVLPQAARIHVIANMNGSGRVTLHLQHKCLPAYANIHSIGDKKWCWKQQIIAARSRTLISALTFKLKEGNECTATSAW